MPRARIFKRRKDKDKWWWGDWDDATGKRHYRKLSPYKDQARDLLQKLVAEAIEEKQLGVGKRNAKMKFSDAVNAYINYCKTINDEKTWTEKEKHLKRFGCVLRVDILIEQIRAEYLETFLVKKMESGCKQATVNAYTNYFRHFFSWLVDTRKLIESPARLLETRNPNNERTRFLWPEEASRLINACDQVRKQRHLKAIVLVALNTGMRENEIFKLRWPDVNLRSGFVAVREGKNREARHIPINGTLERCLEGLGHVVRINTDLLFPSKNRGGNVVPLISIKKSFARALKIAEITDFHFHDLRHTFASWAVMSGMSLYKLSKILGHKSIKMTERYCPSRPQQSHQRYILCGRLLPIQSQKL